MRTYNGNYLENDKKLLARARELRKNMTKEERKLWYGFLSELPVRFKRQRVIGEYIVDFYCDKLKLVIEIDGFHHYEIEEQINKDRQRDSYLNSLGLTVLRYTNRQVNYEFKSVCEDIYNNMTLSPEGKMSAQRTKGGKRT